MKVWSLSVHSHTTLSKMFVGRISRLLYSSPTIASVRGGLKVGGVAMGSSTLGRELSNVPVDDLISGLNDEQILVRV